MRIRVLGSAAGGGFPQWNCACTGCVAARRDAAEARPRSQECAAVSGDGESWLLLNCSPEIRAQIESFPPLHPRGARQSPIAGVMLTNADLDHCLGLLSLREGTRLGVYATVSVQRAFTENNVLCRALDRIEWHTLHPDGGGALHLAGLRVEAFRVPGKPPRYLEGLAAGSEDDNIGLWLQDRDGGAALAYTPGVGQWTGSLSARLAGADCIFFDGTFWSSDELVRGGFSGRNAERMAHLPMSGPEGSLALLHDVKARRIYIHLNNTNPVLLERSAERARVAAAGWEIACDGMEISL